MTPKSLAMTLEDNKTVVRRQFDLIQRRDLDALDEAMAPDIANHALGTVQVAPAPSR
jgi:ketosteroid isomerase-like protein